MEAEAPAHFTPDVLPAATLPIYPGLGQAPIYAGLHTRWLGVERYPLSWLKAQCIAISTCSVPFIICSIKQNFTDVLVHNKAYCKVCTAINIIMMTRTKWTENPEKAKSVILYYYTRLMAIFLGKPG